MTVPHERPTRVRYQVMAFLCVLSFLTYFDRVCIVRAQEDIQRSLDISSEEMGYIFGAFWLAYALFEIPGGWLGDRYGARLTLTRIVLAWSLFTALSGSAVGFLSLLACRFLFGAGEAGAFPNMALVQSRWLPVESRGRAGGLLWLLARWGGAFSPLIFGRMLAGFDSSGFREAVGSVPGLSFLGDVEAWRLGFWAAGLIGAVWCLWFFLWFRDDPARKPSVNQAELELIRSGGTQAAESHTLDRRGWADLFLCPSLWAIGFLYVASSFCWSFYVSWLPRYLKDVHSVEFKDSEIYSGLPFFLGGIFCLLGGWMSDRIVRWTGRKWLGRALFPICGYITAAAAMFGVRFVQSPEQAVVLLCIANAGHDLGQGANWASVVDIGGRFAGTAAGFINMVGNSGNTIGPVIAEKIFSNHGFGALFGVYTAVYLLAASMWLFIDPTRKFYERRPSHSKTQGQSPGFPPKTR